MTLAKAALNVFTRIECPERDKISNIFFEKVGKYFHLLNDLSVILAFKRIKGIFLLSRLLYMFGQISESTNIASFGFQ